MPFHNIDIFNKKTIALPFDTKHLANLSFVFADKNFTLSSFFIFQLF